MSTPAGNGHVRRIREETETGVLLTTREVAERYGVSMRAVNTWKQKGLVVDGRRVLLRCIRVGHSQPRYREQDVAAFEAVVTAGRD